jgi:ATP phosphoribosyltransferase
MSAPLVIAVPAKGRLQENAEAFFARAGLQLVKPRGARDYRGAIADCPASRSPICRPPRSPTRWRRARSISASPARICARDDPDMDQRVVLIEGLGFGFANVVVAVPQAWIDVRSMADLDDVATAFRPAHDRKMRVATKYVNLTPRLLLRHGIVDYRIVESSGATEGAPAAGSAELIVDITTTGTTLAANGLKIVEDGHHPALAGQSRGRARRAWGDGRARDRAPHPRPHRRAGEGARLSRGAHALPGCDDAMLTQAKERFGVVAPFGGTDLVRHADAALPAGGSLRPGELHARTRRPEHRGRRDRLRVRAGQSALRQTRRRPVGPAPTATALRLIAELRLGLIGLRSPASGAIKSALEDCMIRTPICDLLDIEHPIALGGMGSASSPAMTAAVSRAGGLGAMGCHYLTPEQIRERAAATRKETNKPFGLNFCCSTPARTALRRRSIFARR